MNTTPNYRCSQAALYLVAHNVYNSFNTYLTNFTSAKGKYTDVYLTNCKDELTAAENLLSLNARSTESEIAYIQLSNQLNKCTDHWQMLKRYITAAYPEDEQKARLDESGYNLYDKATRKSWDAAKSMLISAKSFVINHNADLSANLNMPASFVTTFLTDLDAFNALLLSFYQLEEQIKIDTENKLIVNNTIYNKITEICLDGQQIFKNNESIKDKFTFNTVLTLVDGVGTSGIKGYIMDSNHKPIAGATLSSPNFDKVAVSDNDGYYELLQVAQGQYNLQATAQGYTNFMLADYTIEPGITRKLDITLSSAGS